ncbi:LADA_0F11826g1_1 [Lachancea dasiensis]|uniref:LADA_0F11826g1_1 n=1 Tax=Lachancea dasiensis TaxID=1072105 RepID=A0A1G4JMG7_9SACH|nr:LADA_0F11826g1_1 [Lachancea dasiensis]
MNLLARCFLCIPFMILQAMLESPVLAPLVSTELDSLGSNVTSPVQFIREYIEKTLNTPPGFPISVAAEHYKRQRLIEEILESEIEYVQMLKILQNCFLDVLTINDYIPMESLNNVVTHLLPQHEAFRDSLNNLVDGSIKRFDESTELNWSDLSLTSWDHLELCECVSKLLATKAVQVEAYRKYVQYYNQVSHLLTSMGQESQDRLLFAVLFRIELCLPKYYSRTSEQGYKRDFSFRAMIQMPINRISKYKLFLESLVLLTENPSITDVKRLDDLECFKLVKSIKTNLQEIYNALAHINEPDTGGTKSAVLRLIQNRLAFDLPEERIPIEAMGPCHLKGCLAVAWPSMDETSYTLGSYRRSRYFSRTKRTFKIESDQLGVFLFRAYLVFAEIPALSGRSPAFEWPVKFALRLSNCRLVDLEHKEGTATEGIGMVSRYMDTIKIQFDYDFKLWELLIFCRNNSEYQSWSHQLALFIDDPNDTGPPVDRRDCRNGNFRGDCVSQSTLESTLHFSDSTTFPDNMIPFISYNESLSGRFDRAKSFKRRVNNWAGQCYHGETAKIDVEFRDTLMEISPSSTRFIRPSSSWTDVRPDSSKSTIVGGAAVAPERALTSKSSVGCGIEVDPWAYNVVFTNWKRLQVEIGMGEVWSSHLERLSAGDADPADVRHEKNTDTPSSPPDTMPARSGLLVRAASDNLLPTEPKSAPVRASTFRATRWSIKRVFSRRRARKSLAAG